MWTGLDIRVSEQQDGKKMGAADEVKKRKGRFLFWGVQLYIIIGTCLFASRKRRNEME